MIKLSQFGLFNNFLLIFLSGFYDPAGPNDQAPVKEFSDCLIELGDGLEI